MFTILMILSALLVIAVALLFKKGTPLTYHLSVWLGVAVLTVGLIGVPPYYGYSVPTHLTYIEEAIVLYVYDENQGFNILLVEKGSEKPRLIFLDRSDITQKKIDEIRDRQNNGGIVVITTKPSSETDGAGSPGFSSEGSDINFVQEPTMLGK